MNRLKLWLFAIVVVAAAGVAVHLHTRALRSDALSAVDVRLDAAAQQVMAANVALAHDAAGAAALVARDPGLAQALAGAPEEPARGRRARGAAPAADPAAEEAAAERAGRAALDAAERALGFRLPDGTTIVAATRETFAQREGALGDAAPLLRSAVDGASPRGHVLLGGKLLYAAAAPAGDGRGVLVLAPVGEAFARGVATASGLPVLLVVPEAKPILAGSLPAADQPEIVKAARVAGVKSNAGRLGPVDLDAGVKLPEVPLLGGAAPAYRVHAVALEGVRGASVVAAAATAPRLAPIAVLQWKVAAGLAVALVLAMLFGLLVRAAEPAPMLPEPLLAAAARIEKGDFAARVPALAGQLGTVAAALNRAVDAASAVPAPVAPPAEDLFAQASRPAEADPSAFDFAARAAGPAGSAALASPPAEEAVLPAPRAPEPAAKPRPAAIVPPPPPADEPLAAPAELLQAAAQAAAASDADAEDEQAHWRQIFSEFLRSRAECGEVATGLTFERFAQKLASNKATLVAKYACRTVRFQVYVKDGKAALKATPVR
jgi:hypothetical protein